MDPLPRSIAAMFGSDETGTFLGLPSCEDLEHLEHPIALIGAGCATPYASVGAYCADGPRAVRDGLKGYAGNLHHFDFDLGGQIFPAGTVTAADCGDLPLDEADAAGNRARITEAITTVLANGAVPVVLGGDDSVPIPMLKAYAGHGPLTIVQIDAHIDWRDEVDGERLGLSSTMRRASEMAHVERIIQVGQRALGSARPGEVEDARHWGAVLVPAREVHERGMEPVLEMIRPGDRVFVSFDWDALDPSIMPAVIGRAPGGLTYWQAASLLQGIAGKAQIAGAALVEFMPERDVDSMGALTAARLLANLVGLLARQADR